MKIAYAALVPLAAALALGGCASTGTAPVSATRFHLGEPVARGTVAVIPVTGAEPSLEFRSYADAVARELARNGYRPIPDAATAQFVADVGFSRFNRTGGRARSPVSIGIGGGGFSGGRRSGFGLGGAIGFPIGGGRDAGVIVSELTVRIRQRPGDSVIWEGRAQGEARATSDAAQPVLTADRLAGAVFSGFPGRSGETITVR